MDCICKAHICCWNTLLSKYFQVCQVIFKRMNPEENESKHKKKNWKQYFELWGLGWGFEPPNNCI